MACRRTHKFVTQHRLPASRGRSTRPTNRRPSPWASSSRRRPSARTRRSRTSSPPRSSAARVTCILRLLGADRRREGNAVVPRVRQVRTPARAERREGGPLRARARARVGERPDEGRVAHLDRRRAGQAQIDGRRPQRVDQALGWRRTCLLYTSPSPRDGLLSRMPSSA